MRKLLMLGTLPILLSGCGTLTDALAPPYVPKPIHVYDPLQYAADDMECSAAGADWKPEFSFGAAAAKTVDGATADTSLIPLNPLVPAYGAGGGLLSAISDGLDIASGQHANVYRNCLRDETRRDRSAIVADPRS